MGWILDPALQAGGELCTLQGGLGLPGARCTCLGPHFHMVLPKLSVGFTDLDPAKKAAASRKLLAPVPAGQWPLRMQIST